MKDKGEGALTAHFCLASSILGRSFHHSPRSRFSSVSRAGTASLVRKRIRLSVSYISESCYTRPPYLSSVWTHSSMFLRCTPMSLAGEVTKSSSMLNDRQRLW